MNIENLNVVEMKEQDMKDINGGLAFFIAGFMLGYMVMKDYLQNN